ncbi:hypothetical protein BJX65DRAFT_92767 [Aspergillus insuetus]
MTFPFSTIYPSISLQLFFGHEKNISTFNIICSFFLSHREDKQEEQNGENKKQLHGLVLYYTLQHYMEDGVLCGYTKKRTETGRIDPLQHGMRMGIGVLVCLHGPFLVVCYFTCPFGYRIFVFNTSSTLAYSLLRLCQSDVPVYSWLHLENWLVLSVQGLIKYGSAHC